MSIGERNILKVRYFLLWMFKCVDVVMIKNKLGDFLIVSLFTLTVFW